MSREVVIIGTGGLGRETAWALVGRSDVALRGFVTSDSGDHGGEVCGLPVLGAESWLFEHREVQAVCAIGDPRARRSLVRELAGRGVRFASAVHPGVQRSRFVEVGAGCIVGASAVLTSQVRLGEQVVVGAGAIVSHDDVLEDFATLAPGVTLAGRVRVEQAAELGVGASVAPGCVVGRGALVGAGAVVVKDVAPNVVVAGVPARVLREWPPPDRI